MTLYFCLQQSRYDFLLKAEDEVLPKESVEIPLNFAFAVMLSDRSDNEVLGVEVTHQKPDGIVDWVGPTISYQPAVCVSIQEHTKKAAN